VFNKLIVKRILLDTTTISTMLTILDKGLSCMCSIYIPEFVPIYIYIIYMQVSMCTANKVVKKKRRQD